MGANTRLNLKWKLFKRQGWYVRDREQYPKDHELSGRIVRYALCSFGCGTILYWDTTTIDHYPIPKRDGGRYTFDNTRLACGPCNHRDGGEKLVPPEKVRADPHCKKRFRNEADTIMRHLRWLSSIDERVS